MAGEPGVVCVKAMPLITTAAGGLETYLLPYTCPERELNPYSQY